MKIAIFHDYFGSIGGGEKLVITLAQGLQQNGHTVDIYTTEMHPQNIARMNGTKISIAKIGSAIQFPVLKQLHASWLFYRARKGGYDRYIMSGNWAIFACKNHHPNIHYIHTPPRMFYDSKKEFARIAPWYAKIPFPIWTAFHTFFLEKQIKYIDTALTNSKNVQRRIKTYYHINAQIVYPPITHYPFVRYGDFWLSVNRFYPHKRIELQIEAFRQMPDKRLIIVGGFMPGDHAAVYAKKIMKNLPKNVTCIGEVSEKRLAQLYGTCEGYITTAQQEDFGMTVLEAMSAGKAVVAVNEGGYKETIIDGKTGYLVEPGHHAIIAAVRKISQHPKKYRRECERRAAQFKSDRFTAQIYAILQEGGPQ